MSITTKDRFCELVSAATEFIRVAGAQSVVSINEVLDELSEKFPETFHVSQDAYEVLNLIAALWEDPRIHDPQQGWIDFYWDEERLDPEHPAPGTLKALLLLRFQSQSDSHD